MKRPKDLDYAKWLGQYYLSFRSYSRAELFDKLVQKEVPKKFIFEALAGFEEAGYIDDLDYAKRYIKDGVNLKKWGKFRIFAELAKRKVPKNIIENAFYELENEVDFVSTLVIAVEKKAQNIDLNDRKQKNKLIAHFARKGYAVSEILKAICDVECERC